MFNNPTFNRRFYSGHVNCDWLKDTALRDISCPEFRSFVLVGNEDAPDVVILYRDANPRFNAMAVAVLQACEACHSIKPVGQSCACFDNDCQ